MPVYDLRREYLSPKEFENITSPNIAKSIIDREYQIIEEQSSAINHIDGFYFELKNVLYRPPSHSLFNQQRLDGIYRLIQHGDIVVTTRDERNRFTHPFFISENGEFFALMTFCMTMYL
jgi:hypothetical protein